MALSWHVVADSSVIPSVVKYLLDAASVFVGGDPSLRSG